MAASVCVNNFKHISARTMKSRAAHVGCLSGVGFTVPHPLKIAEG